MSESLESFLTDKSDLILRDYGADIRWQYNYQKVPHEADFCVFSNFPDSSEVFLDIGASIGLSVASFRLFNPRGKVISFEPCPWLEPALSWLKKEEDDRFNYFMVLGWMMEAFLRRGWEQTSILLKSLRCFIHPY